jgi:hypothetical protein
MTQDLALSDPGCLAKKVIYLQGMLLNDLEKYLMLHI